MTPEQAISNLKEIIELSKDEINKKNENLTAILDLTDLQSLDIVLSIIENQKERIDYLTRSIERKEQSLIEEHEENIEYYTMIEKKDKIIEQMTYYIMNLDIDEDICQKVNCDTNSGELDCKECIIAYFENKVKEVQ